MKTIRQSEAPPMPESKAKECQCDICVDRLFEPAADYYRPDATEAALLEIERNLE